ncbi:uncharacterized protein LOC100572976 [Acyrthosiphon pisum]|uniref:ACYPI53166 protein n=1 Tax=Acyrthosiphon pisum TaxID=7029 RepID=C4WXD1_ACYPI|nr:uncharacterized protein LOC100572976 [Acyrthosiphon pisum]BAH72551.1 ACYPI53166 [Acyrthosiphon pisum]|eukprot:NP_001280301.1 uncharacterized protein LOC100572976 [Acyrthosiphon pisum]
MVSDETLTVLWNRCRLIGIINKICLYFITVILVMYLLPLVTIIGYPYCKHDKWKKTYEMYHSVEKQTSVVTTEWMNFIFICLFIAFLIKMIFVNNGLRSTDIPADGNKVKSWLRWHIDFFVISIATFVGFLFKGRTCSSDDNIYYYIPLKLGITIIVLMIEINVVRKFNKEFNISAIRRNQKCIPLNI